MFNNRHFSLSVVALVGVGALMTGCGKNDTATTTTTTANGGVSAATTTMAPAGSAGGSTPAAANQIAVTLSDTAGVNGPVTMKVAPMSAKAGKVTFVVTNSGTIVHEMVVLKLAGGEAADKLPVADDKVNEDASKGETDDVDPGTTKTVDLDLDAGNYALVCNVEKHYGLGMHSSFTVS